MVNACKNQTDGLKVLCSHCVFVCIITVARKKNLNVAGFNISWKCITLWMKGLYVVLFMVDDILLMCYRSAVNDQ